MRLPLFFLIFFQLFMISCKKEEKPIDPLSYIKLIEIINKNKEIEKSRTQVVSLQTVNKVSTLVLAFALDSKKPTDLSLSPNNAYGIRFTMQDSTLRSKRLKGGSFVLKFKDLGNNQLMVRNFKKDAQITDRYPSFTVDSMDTIVNPGLLDVSDPKTNTCILVGCKGSITPWAKERVYQVSLSFKGIAGETWAIDHGYLNENPKTKEPTKIMNLTDTGIEVLFPLEGKKETGTQPNYNIDTIGTL